MPFSFYPLCLLNSVIPEIEFKDGWGNVKPAPKKKEAREPLFLRRLGSRFP